MRKLKNWIVSSAKNLWGLNWEAKIGILFLIPPIIGVIIFGIDFGSYILYIDLFSLDGWNCISESAYDPNYGRFYSYAVTPAIPLYLGLMAIAGAYLIKGNLKKKE